MNDPRRALSAIATTTMVITLSIATTALGGPSNVALSGAPASRAAAVSGSAAPAISAPDSTSATSGLGFSVAASITDPDLSDSVAVTVTGAPAGTSLSVVRVPSGATIATLGGVIPEQAAPQDYQLTWEAIDTEGQSTRLTTTVRLSPPEEASGTMADRVWRVIRRRYEFGIPAKAVRDLGPNALPHLLAVLRDPDRKKQWANAAAAVGFLGLPTGFDSLHAFLWNRFEGAVDHSTFRALLWAQAAIGPIAAAKAEALDYLVASTRPEYWTPLPWYSQHASGAELRLIMSGRSIYALSLVTDGRAVAALAELDGAPIDPRQRGYIDDALARQSEVLQRGWIEVREGTQRRSAGEP